MNHSCIIRDWTKETLTVEVVNSLGERYYFEVEPGANPNVVPSRSSNSPADKVKNGTFIKGLFTIPVQLEMKL